MKFRQNFGNAWVTFMVCFAVLGGSYRAEAFYQKELQEEITRLRKETERNTKDLEKNRKTIVSIENGTHGDLTLKDPEDACRCQECDSDELVKEHFTRSMIKRADGATNQRDQACSLIYKVVKDLQPLSKKCSNEINECPYVNRLIALKDQNKEFEEKNKENQKEISELTKRIREGRENGECEDCGPKGSLASNDNSSPTIGQLAMMFLPSAIANLGSSAMNLGLGMAQNDSYWNMYNTYSHQCGVLTIPCAPPTIPGMGMGFGGGMGGFGGFGGLGGMGGIGLGGLGGMGGFGGFGGFGGLGGMGGFGNIGLGGLGGFGGFDMSGLGGIGAYGGFGFPGYGMQGMGGWGGFPGGIGGLGFGMGGFNPFGGGGWGFPSMNPQGWGAMNPNFMASAWSSPFAAAGLNNGWLQSQMNQSYLNAGLFGQYAMQNQMDVSIAAQQAMAAQNKLFQLQSYGLGNFGGFGGLGGGLSGSFGIGPSFGNYLGSFQ